MKNYIAVGIVLLLSLNTIGQEKRSKSEIMATITCECLESTSEEDLSKNFETEFKDCFNASILGALISDLPEDEDVTITLKSDGTVDQVSEEDSKKAIQSLEDNCNVYKNLHKQSGRLQGKTNNQVEVVASEACKGLYNISLDLSREERYARIKEEISAAILADQIMNTLLEDTKKAIDSLEQSINSIKIDSLTLPGKRNMIVVDKNYKKIEEFLLRNCDQMKLLMANDEESSEVSISDKQKALELYDKGQKFFRKSEFDNAIKSFKKAVRKDKTFAFAWDMLGFSHRKIGNYMEAIEAYNKSLALDPKGKMPLTNKPIAYALLGDLDKSIEGYEEYIRLYPNDAEGFYGIGRIYHLKGDYENALDMTMKAYLMYQEISSPYARDAEANLGLYYRELKEQDNLELWNKIAEKHNIKIGD